MSSTANLGLEGVVAFETEIAEPDKEGSALRYRGVDIEELAGSVPFERVWGLVVNESLDRGLPLPAPDVEPVSRTGDARIDLQATLPTLASQWGLRQLVDIDADEARDDLARLSSATLSIVAQALRGDEPPVPKDEVSQGKTAAEQFLIRWRGKTDEREAKALDVYWVSATEHGMNASTFTARIAASTGADCAAALSAAVGTLSGPLHGGAPARVLPMLDAVAESGDADKYVHDLLARGDRIMGFGHRVYRAEDPRARVLREPRRSSARRASRSQKRSSTRRSQRSARSIPTGRSRRTSSSGAPSSSRSRACRPRSRPRSSPARAPAAGRRTSSSRSARAG